MRHFLILIFIISGSSFAQKKYPFDYLIEYQFTSYTDSTTNKIIYYITNSKDNSYFAKIKNFDSANFELELIDQDQLWAKTKVRKQDFIKADFINLECNRNFIFKNHFKFRTKEYEYTMLSDTLIDNKYLKNYKLQYIGKRKRKKSFPVGTNHYIIEDSTEFHLPILTHSTAFEEWKEERNIPIGIFKEKILYDFKNEIKYKYILKAYYPINKSIIVPDKCLEK